MTDVDLAKLGPDELAKRKAIVEQLLEFTTARENLLRFTEITMPHPDHSEDLMKSRYAAARHHHALALALEEVEKGNKLRLIISMPPRHGKTELTCRRLIPWFMGRDSYRNVIFATYSDDMAGDVGRQVRATMRSPRYQRIFPSCVLRKGSQASDRMQTEEGGEIHFIGRGGGATGRGADLLIIDDPIKDAEEARSPTIREKIWEWYVATISDRLMTDVGAIVIIMTRWHEDDLIGRLTDPLNPCFVREEADTWEVLRLPFFAETNDPLDREVDEPLWPERFSIEYGQARRRLNPMVFLARYQQRPTAEDGDLFKREWLKYYSFDQRPPLESMRIYAASDHAVGETQKHDATVLLIAGVCPDGKLWLLDCWWQRKGPAEVVEAMLYLIEKWKPIKWWAEKGHISKSIGPFLYKQLHDKSIGNPIEESPTGNVKGANVQRTLSIRGHMQRGLVMFPKAGVWVASAVDELMKFDNGKFDDFVSALSHLGMGIHRMRGRNPKVAKKTSKPHTIGWIKESARRLEKERNGSFTMGGW